MKKHKTVFWVIFILSTACLITAVYMAVLGNPWGKVLDGPLALFSAHDGAGQAESEAEEERPLQYDTEYGNVNVSDALATELDIFISALYGPGYREIAADYSSYQERVRAELAPTATLVRAGEALSPNDFLEEYAQKRIEERTEIAVTYMPMYEIPESETTAYINGTLSVTLHGAESTEYLCSLFGLSAMSTGETYDLPFYVYLVQDGASGDWKVQSMSQGFYLPEE